MISSSTDCLPLPPFLRDWIPSFPSVSGYVIRWRMDPSGKMTFRSGCLPPATSQAVLRKEGGFPVVWFNYYGECICCMSHSVGTSALSYWSLLLQVKLRTCTLKQRASGVNVLSFCIMWKFSSSGEICTQFTNLCTELCVAAAYLFSDCVSVYVCSGIWNPLKWKMTECSIHMKN